ncbi:MAG: hypothetical protein CFE24_11970 [Flavobacterium sp. BFFFF2]|nr:MAG: hypothetical protein CFE24_11970 [Flavobacterium sp. BFFFF2]
MIRKALPLLFTLLLVACKPSSGIITSRDEAIKQGKYSPDFQHTLVASTDTQTQYAPPQLAAMAVVKTEIAEVKELEKPIEKAKKKSKKDKVEQAIPTKIDWTTQLNQSEAYDIIESEDSNYFVSQMMQFTSEKIGIPYRAGGTTPDGFDCSGFVFYTFNKFGVSLPHSSSDMATLGQKVEGSDIKAGDLIFFMNRGQRHRINHVGIVVEANADEIRFIHSSTQSGIVISSTKESYYRKSFVQANRILE